jgi:hypothetical protein
MYFSAKSVEVSSFYSLMVGTEKHAYYPTLLLFTLWFSVFLLLMN